MPWCPDYGGYGPSCPGPTDDPSATYCCTIFWNGVSRPTCCTYPVHTGLVIVLPLAVITLIALLTFLMCHLWHESPMNRRRNRRREKLTVEGRTYTNRDDGHKGVHGLSLERYENEPYLKK